MSKDQVGAGGGSPHDDEDVLFTLVQVLKAQGNARAVSVLVHSKVRVERKIHRYGGCDVSLQVLMDPRIFGQLDHEMEELREIISDVAAQVLRSERENVYFGGVSIVPHGRRQEGWRKEAGAWARGDGVNNQGRVRSDNIAACEHDGLLFRSQPEIHLYNALKARGLTFAPLPVFIRGGRSYRRLEPDFLVLKDGYVFQVEVDGDHYHQETPLDAQDRVDPMAWEGVQVRRFSASKVDTEERAKVAVDQLLLWIEQKKKAGR